MRDVVEDGRADEVAFIKAVARRTLAAALQLRTILAPDVYVAQDCFELAFVNARPHLRFGVAPVADTHAFGALDEARDEFVRHFVNDDGAARRSAALAA